MLKATPSSPLLRCNTSATLNCSNPQFRVICLCPQFDLLCTLSSCYFARTKSPKLQFHMCYAGHTTHYTCLRMCLINAGNLLAGLPSPFLVPSYIKGANLYTEEKVFSDYVVAKLQLNCRQVLTIKTVLSKSFDPTLLFFYGFKTCNSCLLNNYRLLCFCAHLCITITANPLSIGATICLMQ